MSGSKAPAEQGTLIFLTGGDKALFERAGPLLDVMGKAKFFLGQARLLMLRDSHPAHGCPVQQSGVAAPDSKSGCAAQVGNGANMKLVVNMMMGSYMAASAEGLSLAKAVGLAQQDLIEVVGLAAIATPMFKLKVRCCPHDACMHALSAASLHAAGAVCFKGSMLRRRRPWWRASMRRRSR